MLETITKKFSTSAGQSKKPSEEIQATVAVPDVAVETAEPEVVLKCLLTHCRPWCVNCGGWHGIETSWSDGRVDLQCRTCKADMPEQPDLEWKPKESHKSPVVSFG